MTTIKQFTIERIETVVVLLLFLLIISVFYPEVRTLFLIPIVVLLIGTLLQIAFRTGLLIQLEDYERGIVTRRGRFHRIATPGWNIKIPWIEEMKIVDLRQKALNLPPQPAYTADEVKIQVDTIVFYRVTDPKTVVLGVDDFHESLEESVKSAIRDIAGNLTVMELIGEIEKVNDLMKAKIEPFTSDWGITILGVQITNIELPPQIEQAMGQLKRQKDLWAAARWQAKARQMEIEAIGEAAKHLDEKALRYLYLKEALPKLAESQNKIFFPVDFTRDGLMNMQRTEIYSRPPETEKKEEKEKKVPPHIRRR